MNDQTIEIFGGDYEHTLTVTSQQGAVSVQYRAVPLQEVFEGMLAERSYRACEFSLANYIMLKDRDADWISAIPVFPYRAFRHSTLYVREDSPLQGPSELKGRRVGVPDYSMTAAVWTRGILDEQYDVHWSDIRWTASGKQRFAVLEGVELEVIEDDLEDMLIAGELDALLTPHTRDELKGHGERQLRPLIADPQRAEEDYVKLAGIYPINHVVVFREDALKEVEGVGPAVFRAYADSKAAAFKRRLGTTLIPWGQRYWTETFDRFGGDPIPYGLTDVNRKVVSKLAGFLHDQKLIRALPDVDRLFLPETTSLTG